MAETTATHTPGPWTVERDSDDDDLLLAIKAGGFFIATPHFGVPGSVEANARLLAAAPELLEALKVLLHASPASGWEQSNARKQATVAIAKAEGQP